jgi:hypothetical protein
MPPRDRAQRAANRLAEELQKRISPADAERLTRRMLDAIDEVSSKRWDAAVRRAATLPGDIRPEKVKALTDQFVRELAAAGAAAGAAAAAPTVGTAATLLATSAELAWFTGRAGDLILTIAALHGHPDPTVDERRAWVMAVLIYGGSARDEFARALNQASTGIELAPGDRRIPLASVQAANRVMSKLLLRRYGTRRGVAALGRVIPLGIGAVIGAGSNYMAIRALARNADQFFSRLPYSAIDTTATDITGHLPPTAP